MRSFRNNNKRSRFRSNGDKNFNNSFIESQNFQRRSPGRNNQNANKLIDKYSDLAREALSNGDKILSENYFQHADHFLRVSNDKDRNLSKDINERQKANNIETSDNKTTDQNQDSKNII